MSLQFRGHYNPTKGAVACACIANEAYEILQLKDLSTDGSTLANLSEIESI